MWQTAIWDEEKKREGDTEWENVLDANAMANKSKLSFQRIKNLYIDTNIDVEKRECWKK